MAEPSGSSETTTVPGNDTKETETISSFTLNVVSPSTGVASPLTFARLSADTTLQDLRGKIRETLPASFSNHVLRLINRGREISRETMTMREIFGQEALESGNTHTIHLVLRPVHGDNPLPIAPTPNPIVRDQPAQDASHPHPYPQQVNGAAMMQQQLPALHTRAQQLLQIEQAFSALAGRVQQLQRETNQLQQHMGDLEQRRLAISQSVPGSNDQSGAAPQIAPSFGFPTPHNGMPFPNGISQALPRLQQILAQQQRGRLPDRQQGVQDHGSNVPRSDTDPSHSPGTGSPAQHPDQVTSWVRQGVGPQGERWQMTVNETTTTIPVPQQHQAPSQGQVQNLNPAMNMQPNAQQHNREGQPQNANPVMEMQNILRNYDRLHRARHGSNGIQRASSSPPPATRDRSYISQNPAPQPFPPSANAPLGPHFPGFNANMNPSLSTGNTGTVSNNISVEPTVYILMSPSGPRALLLNNTDTYFSIPRRNMHLTSRRMESSSHARSSARAAGPPDPRRDPPLAPRQRHQHREPADPVAPAHPANPGAGVFAAQVWPMIWLIIRLVIFVWFFTAGNSSWSRTLMVTGLAVVVFIVNTGIFNGAAEQVWGPIRRHLETLIPLAGPDAREVLARAAAMPQQQDGARRNGEINTTDVAERLMEQRRRTNAGWIMTQIRRAEHSMLLFLASLVPGVGERHIAAREREAAAVVEAERQREVEASAATGSENAQQEGAIQTAQAEPETNGGNGRNNEGQAEAAPAPPLIDV